MKDTRIMNIQNSSGADYTYNPSFTFPGNLPTEIFSTPSEETPALSDLFSIRQGIRTNEYLILAVEQGRLVVTQSGCDPTYTNAGTLSDRKITVSKLGIFKSWCADDWTAVANQLTNDPTWVGNGNDAYQLTNKLQSFLTDRILDAGRRDIFALSFFANDSAVTTSFWYGNGMEGLFVKLYDANSAYCVKRVGSDLPNQYNSLLGADQALNAFKALSVSCDNRLKAVPANQKVFVCTQTMFENLLVSYETKTYSSDLSFNLQQDGTQVLKYRGVELMPIPYLDTCLEDSTNPWYNSLRHFAILMPKASSKFGNLVLGTENASDLNRLDTFYDPRTRQMYMQASFRLGVQFINCKYIAFYD